MKTFDTSTEQGRGELEEAQLLQWVLRGELWISRNGPLVTLYDRDEVPWA